MKVYTTRFITFGLFKGSVNGAIKHSAVYINQGMLSTLQVGIAEAWIYPLHLGLFYRQQMTTLDDDLINTSPFISYLGINMFLSAIILV